MLFKSEPGKVPPCNVSPGLGLTPPPETIALPSEDINKFYEPLVLLKVLNKATQHAAEQTIIDASIDVSDRAQVFKTFVYKLAHVCDSKKGGDTVTAFAVLRDDDGRAHYVFASNQRSHEKLEQVKVYVQGLLGRVRRLHDERGLRGSVEARLGELLREVFVFNRRRLEFYVKQMGVHAANCVKFRDRENNSFVVVCEYLQHTQPLGASLTGIGRCIVNDLSIALRKLIRVAELIAQRPSNAECKNTTK